MNLKDLVERLLNIEAAVDRPQGKGVPAARNLLNDLLSDLVTITEPSSRVIKAGDLRINDIIVDSDILTDHYHPEPVRVIGLSAADLDGAPAVHIKLAGGHTSTMTVALTFDLEVRNDSHPL